MQAESYENQPGILEQTNLQKGGPQNQKAQEKS